MRLRPGSPKDLLLVALLALVALFLTNPASSDQVTLLTYYPAPSGVYSRMITTGDTWLARDGGAVIVGTTAPAGPNARMVVANGYVGLGTATPTRILHVSGGVRIEDGTQAAGRVLTSDVGGNASWQHCTYAP